MSTPEWQISPAEYFERIELDMAEFERRLRLPNVHSVKTIIPLRDVREVTSPPIPISAELLLWLLRRVKTLDGRMPFADATIQMIKIDPRHLKIGQKFAYRENYLKLLEEIPDIFHRFLAVNGGLSDLGAYFVFGLNEAGESSLACYIPPLLEKHGSDLAIMDGIHRNYIMKQAGSTLNAILIERVGLPFPCGLKTWSEIRVISLAEKSKDINERYFELDQGLFRDLKYLGIDG